MINVARIKQKVKRAIALKPTHIILMREVKTGNGMRGSKETPDIVAELDCFINDSKHSVWQPQVAESGTIQRIRALTLLAVCEGFEIKKDDYFIANGLKYKVTYPGMIISDVYNSDLEVV